MLKLTERQQKLSEEVDKVHNAYEKEENPALKSYYKKLLEDKRAQMHFELNKKNRI